MGILVGLAVGWALFDLQLRSRTSPSAACSLVGTLSAEPEIRGLELENPETPRRRAVLDLAIAAELSDPDEGTIGEAGRQLREAQNLVDSELAAQALSTISAGCN